MGYISVNLIFGIGSVLMNHILTGNLNVTVNEGDVAELRFMSLIYDISKSNENSNEARIWAIVIHALILISGFINMVNSLTNFRFMLNSLINHFLRRQSHTLY